MADANVKIDSNKHSLELTGGICSKLIINSSAVSLKEIYK